MNRVILDVDTGEDDALAILLAAALKLPLKYVVSSYGNTSLENATNNSAAMLELADQFEVPVIIGSSTPLLPHPHGIEAVGAGDFVGENGLCGVSIPPSDNVDVLNHTLDLPTKLLNILREIGPVNYVITGPCTNFARLINFAPEEVSALVDQLFIMGGAVDVTGNSGPLVSTSDSRAEFNFYCDAAAARAVLNHNIPIKLVTWDVTSTITLPFKEVDSLVSKSKVGDFVITLIKAFFESYGLSYDREFEFNDPLTILACLGEGVFSERSIDIVTDSDGYGVVSKDESSGRLVQLMQRVKPAEQERIVTRILGLLGISKQCQSEKLLS